MVSKVVQIKGVSIAHFIYILFKQLNFFRVDLERRKKMVKRASTEARWTVFTLVVDYLPERSLARFAAVSLYAYKILPPIKPPSYAPIVEDFARAAHHPDITVFGSVTEKDTEPVFLTCEYDNNEKLQLRIFHQYYGFGWTLTKCNAYRLKSMIYRAIEANKMIKDRQCEMYSTADFFQKLDVARHKHSFYTLIE